MDQAGKTFPYEPGCRRAFTLVELLVVIAIIGILVSLLLPAVQAAREAARRLQCSNNLKQIALAMHNYHTAHRVFPPGSIIASQTCTPNANAQKGAPWTVQILPYLEEQNRYEEFNMEGNFFSIANNNHEEPVAHPDNERAQRKPMPKYQCPSDPNSTQSEANTNYYGVQGGGPESAAECRNWSSSNHRLLFNNGILYRNSKVRIADVRDGTSNTLLVGESRWWFAEGKNEPYGTHWTWACGFRAAGGISNDQTSSSATDPINTPLVDYDPGLSYASQGGASLLVGTSSRCFGSYHPGGCHFAMADGSVHFVTEGIDEDTYHQLGARSDGGPVGGFNP